MFRKGHANHTALDDIQKRRTSSRHKANGEVVVLKSLGALKQRGWNIDNWDEEVEVPVAGGGVEDQLTFWSFSLTKFLEAEEFLQITFDPKEGILRGLVGDTQSVDVVEEFSGIQNDDELITMTFDLAGKLEQEYLDEDMQIEASYDYGRGIGPNQLSILQAVQNGASNVADISNYGVGSYDRKQLQKDLKKLEARGFLQRTQMGKPGGGRIKNYNVYALTQLGEEVLGIEPNETGGVYLAR